METRMFADGKDGVMPAGTFVGFGFGPIQAGLMLC